MADKKKIKRNLSAIKRARQALKRKSRNQHEIKTLRTELKKARTAVSENKLDAQAQVKKAVKVIDSARSKGLIHKNRAARTVSRLVKLSNKTAPKVQA